MPLDSDQQRQEWRTIEVAPRYLQRNASRTMGGSVVRGLVELVTNARDSGYRLLDEGQITGAQLGSRAIEVEYVVSTAGKRIIVRDRFEGMTPEVMREKLLKYGVPSSGYESGQFVRGMNARGAKDVGGLGNVKFESIRGGGLR
jgi:hypothetical protein